MHIHAPFLSVFFGKTEYFLQFYTSSNAITRIDSLRVKQRRNRFCDLFSGGEQKFGSQKTKLKNKATREWYFTH